MAFYNKIQKIYRIEASNTYDLTAYSDWFEADAELSDFSPATSGGWHEPAEGGHAEIHLTGFSFDTKEIEKDDDEFLDMLKKIKPNDLLKVNMSGSVRVPIKYQKKHDIDPIGFEFDKIKVKNVKWNKDEFYVACDEYHTETGHAPSQSYQGWQHDL